MGFLKNYILPRSKTAQASDPEKQADQVESPQNPTQTFRPSIGPRNSRPVSGHSTRANGDELSATKCEVIATWLFQEQIQKLWNSGSGEEGVVVRKPDGTYTCYPPQLAESEDGFAKAVQLLNVRVRS